MAGFNYIHQVVPVLKLPGDHYLSIRKVIDPEKRQFLKKELKEYEKITPMTAAERKVLHEWGVAGWIQCVHENSSMAVYEGGRPVDFLDVYREEEDIRRALNTMNLLLIS